jgi:hypothetical protein
LGGCTISNFASSTVLFITMLLVFIRCWYCKEVVVMQVFSVLVYAWHLKLPSSEISINEYPLQFDISTSTKKPCMWNQRCNTITEASSNWSLLLCLFYRLIRKTLGAWLGNQIKLHKHCQIPSNPCSIWYLCKDNLICMCYALKLVFSHWCLCWVLQGHEWQCLDVNEPHS